MAYSSNPYVLNVRRQGVNLVLLQGWSVSQAARHLGVHRTTVWRWLNLSGATDQRVLLRTRSSRPHTHPKQTTQLIVDRVLELRNTLKRCAVVIQAVLVSEGIRVSIATVGRILARYNYTNSWYGRRGKQHRQRTPRPRVETPGSLVQIDTIHFADWRTKERYFAYTLIDLKTRWAYAEYSATICPEQTKAFVTRAQAAAPFIFDLIQTDNGQEFGSQFENYLHTLNIKQRRIRLGKKNDNAHIERFNRTIQEECLGKWPTPSAMPKKLIEYLEYYNTKRLHLGIQCMTPQEVLQRF